MELPKKTTRFSAVLLLIAALFFNNLIMAQQVPSGVKSNKVPTAQTPPPPKPCTTTLALYEDRTKSGSQIYGFVDNTGKIQIEAKYNDAKEFNEGLAPVAENGRGINSFFDRRWGYIDALGKWIIPPTFYEAMPFYEGLAAVQDTLTGKFGVIDISGQLVIPFQYDWIGKFSKGIAPIGVGNYDNLTFGFIDKTGAIILEPNLTYNTVWWNDEVKDKMLTFTNGLMPARQGEKYGYINKKGVFVIPPKYTDVTPFSEGFAFVVTNGRASVIDVTGKMVIAPIFDYGQDRGLNFDRLIDEYQFSGGVSPVRLGGKWGLINTKGAYILKPSFSKIYPFYEGLALFYDESAGGYGFLNTKGNVVIQVKKELGSPNSFSNGLATFTFYDHANQMNHVSGVINKRGETVVFKKYIQFTGSRIFTCADR